MAGMKSMTKRRDASVENPSGTKFPSSSMVRIWPAAGSAGATTTIERLRPAGKTP
jgi:hypothetical protein